METQTSTNVVHTITEPTLMSEGASNDVMPPFKIAVLASTNGTDLQAIIDEMKADKMPGIELSCVISNKENCYALERSREQGYEAIFVNPNDITREEFDTKISEILEEHEVDLVVLDRKSVG